MTGPLMYALRLDDGVLASQGVFWCRQDVMNERRIIRPERCNGLGAAEWSFEVRWSP